MEPVSNIWYIYLCKKKSKYILSVVHFYYNFLKLFPTWTMYVALAFREGKMKYFLYPEEWPCLWETKVKCVSYLPPPIKNENTVKPPARSFFLSQTLICPYICWGNPKDWCSACSNIFMPHFMVTSSTLCFIST